VKKYFERWWETMKTQPKTSAAQEKKDTAIDKKQGVKENSAKDMKMDSKEMMASLKSARGMK
jgi:hypothetical protein